jgi:glycosyltransferase involved in cell wall biosynthesis
LLLAEAMSIGKTVICTGYSGNMDFTLPGSALPVEYSLVRVGPGNKPYAEEAMWAAPDVEHAAALLRQARLDESMRARLGEEARRRIRREFSAEAVGRTMRRRVEALFRRLASND